jgi:hypothetical protein
MARYCKFVVEGKGVFPVDMLRYDHAYPASTDSAGYIVHKKYSDDDDDSDKTLVEVKRKVELIAPDEPTEARWTSFGWRVSDVKALR